MKEFEQRWLDRFRRGDPEAFEVIYETFGDSVYRVCYRLSGCRSDAEDLTQETFVAAFRSRERFEGRASIGTWLYRLALDRCRNLHRKASTHTLPLLTDVAPSDSYQFDGREEAMDIQEALLHLPEHLRESLLLVKVEGLKYCEAAEVMGAPAGTIKFWVHEGLSRMRRFFPEAECGGCA